MKNQASNSIKNDYLKKNSEKFENRYVLETHSKHLKTATISVTRPISRFGLVEINSDGLVNKFEYFFGEDQGRYIIEINKANIKKVSEILNNNSVHHDELGIIDEKMLSFKNDIKLPIEELSNAHKYWLKRYMDN